MDIIKKIFNMKTYAVLYTIGLFIFYLLGAGGDEPLTEWSSVYGSFLLIALSIGLCFGLSVCYAVGWKKKLYSNATAALFTVFNIIISFLVALKWCTIDLLNNETVSSVYFFLALIFGFLYLLFLYIPVLIPTIIYFVKSGKYDETPKPILKIIFGFFVYNSIFTVTEIVYTGQVFTSVFDYFDVVAGCIAAAIGFCYAWNIKLKWKNLVRLLVLFAAVECCMPISLFSEHYKEFTDISIMTSNWFGLLCHIALNVFTVIIIYRYAFTKEIYIENDENIL